MPRALRAREPTGARDRLRDSRHCVRSYRQARWEGMLLIIAVVLLLFWIGGLAFRIAGGLIHVLLVVALIVIVLHFLHAGG